jgi:hypothetical protein
VPREEFKKAARRLVAFKRKPDAKGIESGSSGPGGGDFRGGNRMVFTHTLQDGQGNRRHTSITLEQPESTLDRSPARPRVAGFEVSEAVAAPQNR